MSTRPGTDPRSARDEEMPLHLQIAADKARKRRALQDQLKKDAETALPAPSTVRDVVVPAVIVAAGIALLFVEATTVGKRHPTTFQGATALVLWRMALKTGLTIAAVLLSGQLFDVTLAGTFGRNVLSFCAVAIGPAAVKGLLMHAIGSSDLGGIAAGVFGSLLLYVLLFKFLLKTDARDTIICVTLTWGFITLADYLEYRYFSATGNSWL